MKNSDRQGDMKPEVSDFQVPSAAYCQMYDQSPTNYIERNDAQRVKAASKIKADYYKGRYN